MNRMNAVMRMQLKDKWTWILIPVIVLFSSFFVNLLIGYLVREEEGIYSGGLSSVYVYSLVAGIISPSQMFPFALGMSVRRRDYFWGTAATIGIFSVAIALLQTVLAVVEGGTGGWGVKLHFFDLPYLNAGGLAAQLLVSFSFVLFMYTLGFVIASIFRRFGRLGMFLFFGILALGATVGSLLLTYFELWMKVFHWMGGHSALFYAGWLLPVTVVLGLLAYLLLRRAT